MADLTEREEQILTLVSRGDTNEEIGKKLYIAEDTVKTHLRRMFRRVRARNRAHVVRIGFEGGLLGSQVEPVNSARVRAAANVLRKHRHIRAGAPADSRFALLYDDISAALATPEKP